MNTPSLDAASDPGQDGVGSSKYAADSFAVEMGYYPGDFARSGSPNDSASSTALHGTPKYDGNIASVTSHIGKKTAGVREERLTGETYAYDELVRLRSSRMWLNDTTSGGWDTTTAYTTSYAYDPNGNIDTLKRNAYLRGMGMMSGAKKMDELTYTYDAGGSDPTNHLTKVADAVTGEPYQEDISAGQGTNNYGYDANGNLTSDASENLTMSWDSRGQMKRSTATAGGHTITTSYLYDAIGNRVKKTLSDKINATDSVTVHNTFYVYDASGIVVAIYEQTCTAGSIRAEKKHKGWRRRRHNASMHFAMCSMPCAGSPAVALRGAFYHTRCRRGRSSTNRPSDGCVLACSSRSSMICGCSCD